MNLLNIKKLDLKTILVISVSIGLLFIIIFVTNFIPKTLLFLKKHPDFKLFLIITIVSGIVVFLIIKYQKFFGQEDESLRVLEYTNKIVKKKFGISLSFLGTKVIGLMDKELIDSLFGGRRAYSINASIREYNTRFLALVLANPFQMLRWDFSELISEDEDAFHYYLDLTTPKFYYPPLSKRTLKKTKNKRKSKDYESEIPEFLYENEEGVTL